MVSVFYVRLPSRNGMEALGLIRADHRSSEENGQLQLTINNYCPYHGVAKGVTCPLIAGSAIQAPTFKVTLGETLNPKLLLIDRKSVV